MLHILWAIIKFILILAGVLIGLALAVILLILFCPVRYVGQQRPGKLGTCQVHSQGQLAFRTGILADLLSGWKRKTQSEACWYLAVWKKEKKKKKEA